MTPTNAVSTGSPGVTVVGGAGHVGLPLALTLAESGFETWIYDLNASSIETILGGQMPFSEDGGQETLTRVLASGRLHAQTTPDCIARCEFIVMVIGTPLDEYLNPHLHGIRKALEACLPYLRDDQLLILRSTVFPGISSHIQRYLKERGIGIDVAFCPERVAEGHSLKEFRTLPQIVSGFSPRAIERSRWLFGHFAPETLEMEPMEAEICKLMTNAWRYIQFATVNQFFMLATDHGLDFDRILHGCRHNYPRMAGVPGPGFAAGPCLRKDTMQLAAFSQSNFLLGQAAMLVNEGMPGHLIHLAQRKRDISGAVAGILGMAFKAESDDPRDSLSYKLKKLLQLEAGSVLCTDPYIHDPGFVDLKTVLEKADVLFVGAPHRAYRGLTIPAGKTVIDPWGVVQISTRGDS